MRFKAKALVIAIALLAQFTLIASPQDESGFDFRKTKWGMSEVEVKASEDNQPYTRESSTSFDTILIYKGAVANLQTVYGYKFVSDQLVETSYFFVEQHSNKNDYIYDYKKIKEILTGKYGQPESDRVIWKNNLYRDSPERYGMAVSKGDLVYSAEWKTPSTFILLGLSGDNYEIKMVLFYQSLRLKSLVDAKTKKTQEEDF